MYRETQFPFYNCNLFKKFIIKKILLKIYSLKKNQL